MSSTKRGSEREVSDYYKTPVPVIVEFLEQWAKDDGMIKPQPTLPFEYFLDPCAGGIIGKQEMSYPVAVENCSHLFPKLKAQLTVDVRSDSPADMIADYRMFDPSVMSFDNFSGKPDLIMTNPPFFLAQEIIEKALKDVAPTGYVVMLLRLNFFGGFKRLEFWQRHMPVRCYVHSKRIGFTDDGKTDSIEYMHCIWHGTERPDATKLKILGGDVLARRLNPASGKATASVTTNKAGALFSADSLFGDGTARAYENPPSLTNEETHHSN